MSLAGSSLMGEMQLVEAWAAKYEPLVRSTTMRWCGRTELDPEEFAQELRVKVWRALVAFNPERIVGGADNPEALDQAERSYVFSLVFNKVKDLLKKKKKAELYIEDVAPSLRADGAAGPRDRFEARYLEQSDYETEGLVGEDGLLVPGGLSDLERAVLLLRYLDVLQVEMPALLGVSLREVKRAVRGVRAAARVELGWEGEAAERPAPVNGQVKRFPVPAPCAEAVAA